MPTFRHFNKDDFNEIIFLFQQNEVAKEVIQVPLRQLKKRVENPDHGPPDLKPETQSTDEIPETEIAKPEVVVKPEIVVTGNVGIQLPHPLQTRLNQIGVQVGTTGAVVEVFLHHQGTIEGAKLTFKSFKSC